MEVLDVLVDKLDALGVLVVVVIYLLARERLAGNKKVGNPNGIIKAIERLEEAVRDHNEKSNERLILVAERLSNMGTNMAAVFTLLGEIKTACITMTVGRGNPE